MKHRTEVKGSERTDEMGADGWRIPVICLSV